MTNGVAGIFIGFGVSGGAECCGWALPQPRSWGGGHCHCWAALRLFKMRVDWEERIRFSHYNGNWTNGLNLL